MPTNTTAVEAKIFKECGTLLRGITFNPRSNRRPAVLRVRCKGMKNDGTILTLEGNSFERQYSRAVEALATGHGISLDDALRARMAATAPAFLAAYGLAVKIVTITYDEVIAPEPKNTLTERIQVAETHAKKWTADGDAALAAGKKEKAEQCYEKSRNWGRRASHMSAHGSTPLPRDKGKHGDLVAT